MRWTVKPHPGEQAIKALATALNVEELVAQLLLQRGITTFEEAKKFFRPQLSDLHDPFLMKDMDVAVERIDKAIAKGENILVYGDYDVDGATSVALVSSYLETLTPNVATYIPDRYSEGYGVSYRGIDFAADNDITLIIALDCGIKAIDKVAYAKEKGVDFIICDHHRPGNTLPQAVAVLDPKREDCPYPYDELCGCGVGFKLIQALGSRRGQTVEDLVSYLDLVVTAIGADIVPITGENRILAYWGLKLINTKPRTGFKAIIDQIKKRELTITDVVFIIAPRINAAGRMDHGRHAVDLLRENDLERAKRFAQEIEQYNTDRRNLDREIAKEALLQIQENKEENGFTSVVYKETWHKGVIGIVASRLIETYYRPTLVFTKSGDKLAASARSIKGFDVYGALEECADTIEQFGGHKYAAGLTLLEENYEAFKTKFEEVVSKSIDKNLLVPEIMIDAVITLDRLSPKLLRILKQFAPFGPGNGNPLLMAENVRDSGHARTVGQEGKHLKCCISASNTGSEGPFMEAIGFNLGAKLPVVQGDSFNVVFSLDENEWQGNTELQLKIKDIK